MMKQEYLDDILDESVSVQKEILGATLIEGSENEKEMLANILKHLPSVKSQSELKEKTGYGFYKIRRLSEKYCFVVPKDKRGRPLGSVKITEPVAKQRIDENLSSANSITELQEKTGLPYLRIKELAEKYDLILPQDSRGRPRNHLRGEKIPFYMRGNRKKHNLIIDRLVVQGVTLEEMAQSVGRTREGVRQYLLKQGMHSYWEKKRRKRKVREFYNTQLSDLTNYVPARILAHQGMPALIKAHIFKKLENEPIYVQKAFEYYYRSKVRTSQITTIEKLVEIFKIYYDAKESGEKLSYKDFEVKTGVCFVEIGRVLNGVNLPSFHWNVEDKARPTSEEQKQAILRAEALEINYPDIGYFLKLPCHTIQQTIQNNVSELQNKTRQPFHIAHFGRVPEHINKLREVLSYRKASEIYEAVSLKFKKAEILDLLDISANVYDYAIENKKDIKSKIIHALDVLYPDKKHFKPYLT